MNRRRGGLGSGLDALLPKTTEGDTAGIRQVPVDSIRPNPRQPRTSFDETALNELADSIREHGIIQPLIVSEQRNGLYELIAGERRWRASQRAGLEQVPVIVREAAGQQLLELALIENVQRADLNALEEAHAYQALVDDFGLSDNQIAQRLGKQSREAIANTRRLLQLVPAAQEAILKHEISAGHGRALLKLREPEQQNAALRAILLAELTVREAEQLGELTKENGGNVEQALDTIRSQRTPHVSKAAKKAERRSEMEPPKNQISADDEEVRRTLEQVLSTPVSINRSDRELRITIAFHTEEKLQEFFDWINSR